jgi:hypothetical protein
MARPGDMNEAKVARPLGAKAPDASNGGQSQDSQAEEEAARPRE